MKNNPLDNLVKVDHTKPPRIAVLGKGGVGKSTLASNAPSPIFIQTEDGLSGIDVPAFDICLTLNDFYKQLDALEQNEHDYKTLVIDSADWLDQLICAHVAQKRDVESIADVRFGNGYKVAATEWKKVLKRLDRLRDNRMIVIFTAHSHLSKVEDPRYGDYHTLTFRMHQHSGALLEDWCDIILFCDLEMHIKQEDKGFGNTKGRAVSTGQRVMYTTGCPSYTAKNRYSLPPILPLDWGAFQVAYKKGMMEKKKKAQQSQPTKEA